MTNLHIVIIDPNKDEKERELNVNTHAGLQIQVGSDGLDTYIDLTPQEVSKLVNVLKAYLDHVCEVNP